MNQTQISIFACLNKRELFTLSPNLTHKSKRSMFIAPNQFVWIMINFFPLVICRKRFLLIFTCRDVIGAWNRARGAILKWFSRILFCFVEFLCAFSPKNDFQLRRNLSVVAHSIGYEVIGIFRRWRKKCFTKWPRHARSVIPSHSYPQLCISLFEIHHENSCRECVSIVSLFVHEQTKKKT